jgi:hypothetical protein
LLRRDLSDERFDIWQSPTGEIRSVAKGHDLVFVVREGYWVNPK